MPTWTVRRGEEPLVATAIHHGHLLRDDLLDRVALSEAARLREEDPHTGSWTRFADTAIVVHRSRFECDLNRPRSQAIYRRPEDAWGLSVWSQPLSDDQIDQSLELYDQFYAQLRSLLEELTERHGRIVVYDIHSFNYRREGHDRPADPQANPDINVGTGTLDRCRWGAVADRFLDALSSYRYLDGHLDVRENVNFRGGYMSRWIHETFPTSVCVLAIEVKKFYMDEWTGKPFAQHVEEVGRALASTTPGVLEQLRKS